MKNQPQGQNNGLFARMVLLKSGWCICSWRPYIRCWHMLCALRCSSLFVVCGVWCVVRWVCDLCNVTSRDWTFHAPAFPGFPIELLNLSVRNNEKVTRGVDFIVRFSLTRVSAEQTEHTGDQYIACLLYTSPSPRDLSTSRMPSSA